jgi:serine/threonine protein kinase
MQLEPGQQIGEYEIIEVIGSGGFSIVYKAHDQLLDRAVAIKQLNLDEALEIPERTVERFQNEARLAASLNHPHIVITHALRQEGDDLLLVMEYMDGGSIRDLITQGGYLSQNTVVKMAMQVCRALGILHARGIIHRDIKPENILCSAEGDYKLADFGLAHNTRIMRRNSTGPQSGTLLYMSPEQALGENVTARSDIYSLATVLYEALTGRYYLGNAADDEERIEQIVAGQPAPPSVWNPLLEALDIPLLRALKKDPADRQPNVRAFFEEIRAASRQRRSQELPHDLAVELKTIRLLRDVLNEPEQAIARLSFPWVRDADFPEVLAERGEMLLSVGDVENGLDLLRQAVAFKPELPYAQLALAKQFEAWGNANAYSNAMVSAITSDADLVFASLYNDLIDARNNNIERFWKIVGMFQRAATASGKSSAHYNMGRAILLVAGYEREAVICFQQAMDLSPTHGGAYVALGKAYMALGEHEQAIGIFRRAVMMDFPQYPEEEYLKVTLAYRRMDTYLGLINACFSAAMYMEAAEAALEMSNTLSEEFEKYAEPLLGMFLDQAVKWINEESYEPAIKLLRRVIPIAEELSDGRLFALINHAERQVIPSATD